MNILLPTDFSDNSKNAAAYALQFFHGIPCTFHFLYVAPLTLEKSNISHHHMPETVQKNFNDLLTWLYLKRINPEHQVQINYKINYLIEAVREQVKLKNIDFILMGTRGVSNHKNTILGKNTSDVVMKVKCPALAISENAVYKTHQEILFPTDYKVPYSYKMLESFKSLSSLSNTSVKILELFSSENEPDSYQLKNKLSLENSLSPEVPEIQTFYQDGNSDTQSLFRANKNVDMIVIAAKNLNLCQKLLRNHNNHQIPFIRKLPLLILHD